MCAGKRSPAYSQVAVTGLPTERAAQDDVRGATVLQETEFMHVQCRSSAFQEGSRDRHRLVASCMGKGCRSPVLAYAHPAGCHRQGI